MEVPAEYHELYNAITDDKVFELKKWYKMPKDSLRVAFLYWYQKRTLNIEFSDDRFYFQVVRFTAPIIPKWGRHIVRELTPYKKALLPEAIEKQRLYWEKFHEDKRIAKEAKQDKENIDDLSLL